MAKQKSSANRGTVPNGIEPTRQWRNRIVGSGEEDAAQLLANPRNWRVHPKAQQQALEGVLDAVGWVQNVIVNRTTGFVVDGHARVAMAISRGEKVPVVYVELTEEEEALILATLDPLSAMAGTDKDLLARLTAGMSDAYKALHGATTGELMSGHKDAPEPQMDRAEELLAKWQVKRGQIWEISKHRLMCGDSTVRADVEALMQGEKAGLMNTDPPYGVDYGDIANSRKRAADKASGGDGKDYEDNNYARITNDDLHGVDFQKFLESSLLSALPWLRKDTAFYLWHPMLTQGAFAAAAAAAAADILIHRQIIWVKPSLIMGRGDYHWRHELCFYGWIKGNRPPWLRGRDQDTVWEIGRENDHVHPTQKPVELFQRPILNHLLEGEICYEPFSGSGPQFCAAEQTGRLCYGLEIEPKYCAVILERMSAMGLVPELAQNAVSA